MSITIIISDYDPAVIASVCNILQTAAKKAAAPALVLDALSVMNGQQLRDIYFTEIGRPDRKGKLHSSPFTTKEMLRAEIRRIRSVKEQQAEQVPQQAEQVPRPAVQFPRLVLVPQQAVQVPQQAEQPPQQAVQVPQQAEQAPQQAVQVPQQAQPAEGRKLHKDMRDYLRHLDVIKKTYFGVLWMGTYDAASNTIVRNGVHYPSLTAFLHAIKRHVHPDVNPEGSGPQECRVLRGRRECAFHALPKLR